MAILSFVSRYRVKLSVVLITPLWLLWCSFRQATKSMVHVSLIITSWFAVIGVFVCSFIDSCIWQLIFLPTCPLVHSFILSFIHSGSHSIIYPCIYAFIDVCMHIFIHRSSTHWFILLLKFMYTSTNSFIQRFLRTRPHFSNHVSTWIF